MKGNSKQGMTIKPDKEMRLDMHVNADFAVMFNPEDSHDPTSITSKTWCILSLEEESL